MSKTLRLPRVEMPKETRVLRDRRKRKDARSSQKSRWRKESVEGKTA